MPRTLRLAALALAVAATGAAHAMGFGDAIQAARQFDAQLRAATHELESSRQVLPMARANLLPSVTFNASGANVTGTREFPNALNQQVRLPLDYDAPQASLQLRSPVFNYEALSRYRQAGAQVEGAEALYQARVLDLADRTGTAYMQALLAHETVVLVEVELRSLRAHQLRAEQRLLRGEGTRTEVAQAQSAVDSSQARLIEAQDQLDIALRGLRRITGLATTRLNNLPPDSGPAALEPRLLQDWLDIAERNNPVLRMRRQNVQAATYNVDRNRAGHLPRVDFVAGVSRARNDSVNNLDQVSTLRSIGLQLSVPLYAGGGIEAGVQQSLSDRARAEEELRTERESVQLEIQRQHSAVTSGPTKIDAYRRALASSETALEGVTKALAAGLATTADVLEAQTKRSVAWRDLAQARYEVLMARMRLMLQAGLPLADVVADLDRVLVVDSPLEIRTQP